MDKAKEPALLKRMAKSLLLLAVVGVFVGAGLILLWMPGESAMGKLFNQAKRSSDSGDFESAIAIYAKAIELDPNYADAYYKRGFLYARNGDNDRAIADFTRVIELKPNHADAYYRRGFAHDAKGDNDRAIEDFRKSLKLFTAPYDRGNALRELQRLGAKQYKER
ncbi:MAG TPA: tetratricopeptide repeat protein [Blastocatellia bacterium]|nr:tetratricopeptide repeat protein [Blastocatellia bacterium]